MPFTPIVVPELQQARAIVDKEGRPTPEFTTWLNNSLRNIGNVVTELGSFLDQIVDLNDLITQAEAAIVAVEEAAAETTAQTELVNSYVTGLTITATDAGSDVTITISGHNRVYPKADGTNTTVAVTGGSLTALAYSTTYHIYYDQPSRAGGAVTYVATTSATTAAQTGNRHSVGAVTTPAALAAPVPGRVVRPPGYVEP